MYLGLSGLFVSCLRVSESIDETKLLAKEGGLCAVVEQPTFLPIKSVVGSCRKVSRMVMSESSFCRNKPSVSSQVFRNGPGSQF